MTNAAAALLGDNASHVVKRGGLALHVADRLFDLDPRVPRRRGPADEQGLPGHEFRDCHGRPALCFCRVPLLRGESRRRRRRVFRPRG